MLVRRVARYWAPGRGAAVSIGRARSLPGPAGMRDAGGNEEVDAIHCWLQSKQRFSDTGAYSRYRLESVNA